MPQQNEWKEIDQMIAQYGAKKSAVISILQEVQKQYRYLPAEILTYVAKMLSLSEAKVFGVATFYENFSLHPKGKYLIKICDGTACHVRKSIPILEALQKELSLSDKKQTTEDMLFTVETVSCLGACGLAPVITVNDKVYPAMTPDSARAIIQEIRKEEGK